MIYNIFFIHKGRGLNLLQHSFSGSKLDEDLVSGFISALISFIDALQPPTEDYQQEKLIRTVDRGDFKILIETGETVMGILFVNIEKVEVRKKLREIIKQFEQKFKLKDWAGTIEVDKYESFKEIIFKKFATEIIQISDVPNLTPFVNEFFKTHDELDLLGELNLSAGLLELLMRIDGTSDVQEIANRLECPVEEAIEKIGYLFELGDFITIESPVNETDIYVLTPEAMPVFRMNTYERETIVNLFGSDGIDILLNIDSSRSVQGIQKKTNIDLEKIKEVLRFSSMEQLIKRVRVHPIIRESVDLATITFDKELSSIFKKIMGLCDGNHSLREIAKNLNVPIPVITGFLVTLGDHVEWSKK
ncbi:MAG: hypothetical protein HWN66_15640 [Candidatus Helarchaeota archaeon]|nr:hypothetical protein [Candidatus Helarchaeota archaeon]